MKADLEPPPGRAYSTAAIRLRSAATTTLAATLVLAAHAYWNGFEEYVHAPKVIVIQAGVAAAGVLWACARRHDPTPLVVPKLFLPLGALILWGAGSALWATDAPLALDTAAHWAAGGLAALLASQLINEPGELRRVLWSMSLATGGIATVGLLQVWDVLTLVPQATAPAATFGNRNMAAEAVVFLLPASLLHFLVARSRWALGFTGATIAASLAFLVFARSRASWLAAAAEIAVFLALGWRHRHALSLEHTRAKRWGAAVVVGGAVLLVVARGHTAGTGRQLGEKVLERSRIAISDTRESGLGGLARSETRPVLFLHALQLAAEHPVKGVGLAGFGAWFPGSRLAEDRHPGTYFDVMFWHYANTHNDWLQLASELGLVGVALLLATLWLGWGSVCSGLRAGTSPNQPALSIAALALGVGASVNASFSFPFYSAFPGFVFALLLGAAAAPTVAPSCRLRLPWSASVGFALILAGLLAGRITLHARKEAAVGRMIDAARQADHASVIAFGEAALRTPFSNQLALSYLGRAYDETGDVPRALGCAEAFLVREPFSANQRFFRAHCLARSGRKDEAMLEAKLAARLARATPLAQLNAARLLEKCGDPAGALDILRALRDTDAIYDLDYGLTALRSGRTDIATTALQRAAGHSAHAARQKELLQLLAKISTLPDRAP